MKNDSACYPAKNLCACPCCCYIPKDASHRIFPSGDEAETPASFRHSCIRSCCAIWILTVPDFSSLVPVSSSPLYPLHLHCILSDCAGYLPNHHAGIRIPYTGAGFLFHAPGRFYTRLCYCSGLQPDLDLPEYPGCNPEIGADSSSDLH